MILQIFLLFCILNFINAQTSNNQRLYSPLCEFYPVAPLGMTDRFNGIKNEQVTSSSFFSSQTLPYYGRLHISDGYLFDPTIAGGGAWTALNQNNKQYIQIDLLERKVIVAVATQGRQGAREWVSDYYIYYTDADTPVQWSIVRDRYGEPRLFNGNYDDNTVKINVFEFPIVARYIRINPQIWNSVISLRPLTFLGPFIANFDGKSWIDVRLDLPDRSIQTAKDYIRFRFRTKATDGLIFYGADSQGDYFTIELFSARLRVNVNLGNLPGSKEIVDNSIDCGSLLDDDQWHEVRVIRDLKNINITVDWVTTWRNLSAVFDQMNMNRNITLGGLPNFAARKGVTVINNFVGCIEEFYYNGMAIIRDAQRIMHESILSSDQYSNVDWLQALGFPPRSKFLWWGPVITTMDLNITGIYVGGSGVIGTSCPPPIVDPTVLTFPARDNYVVWIRVMRDQGLNFLQFSFRFRTFNRGGTLFYQQPGKSGNYISLSFNATGQLVLGILMDRVQPIEFSIKNPARNSPDGTFADGLWHSVNFRMTSYMMRLILDDQTFESKQVLPNDLSFDKYSFIGGGRPTEMSFQGCISKIVVNDAEVVWSKLDTMDKHQDILNGTCMIMDRCHPNPCKHEAPCTQSGSQFFCNCNVTGYGGAVCHMSENFNSCSEYGLFHSMANEKKFNITIDLDGSGVLEPIDVECDFNDPGMAITRVFHRDTGYVRVDGYDNPGSYRRKIDYMGNSKLSLSELARRSIRCEQAISYRCRNARLLKLPVGGGQTYDSRAWGWWIGRRGQSRFYWGGGVTDLQRCSCGINQDCEQNSPTCNCDYITVLPPTDTKMMVDSGMLNFKDDLPVTEVRFGDTGTLNDDKWSEHSVDVLKCYGDLLFNNTVTFRKTDAAIELDPIFAENEFDMSFIFKTTILDAVLVQNTGRASGHFFEVRIRQGTSIRFAFNVGNGMQLLEMMVPGWLNNNEWHVVRLERNRKESRLIVDKNQPIVLIETLDRSYQQFRFDQNLFIGSSEAYTEGFLGCISNLIINGIVQDLKGLAMSGKFSYGTSPGCVEKCNPNPCLNMGECYEQYSHYTCECGLTSWRGFICGRQCGAAFNGQEGPMMVLKLSEKDRIGTMEEYIQIGFKTKSKKGILMQVIGTGSNNYITLKINSNGGVSIEFDVGFERFEITTQGLPDLTNDQHHLVRAWRVELGRIWKIKVDDYPTLTFPFVDNIKTENADTRLDGPHTIYIGRNTSMTKLEAFDGCMYQAQWNNIFPFRNAFQNPQDPNVDFDRNIIREDQCGYVEILPKPEPLEIRPTPELPSYIDFQKQEDNSIIYKRIIAGVVTGLILLIILIFLIFFCRYFTIERGDYETREAKGTSKLLAADDAIRYGRSGQPEVEENEYWI